MNHENKWLVKSSDTVSGPFEFDQVTESIFSGDIHLLDEIKGPFERWRPIKDHSLFAAAIEKLKATTYSRRENTVTATVDLLSKTVDLTQTIPGTDDWSHTPSVDELTPDNFTKTQGKVESPLPPPPVYQGQKTASSSRIWVGFVLSVFAFLVSGLLWLLYESRQAPPAIPTQNASQLTDEAMMAMQAGEYQKALSNFIMATNLSGHDPLIVLEMAPLSVQFDGQFSHVEVMVENLLATHYKKDFMKRGKNVVGMTYSYRGRYKEALKSYEESLEVDGQYLPAQINKAYALIKLGEYAQASSFLRRVVETQPQSPLLHFLYVKSLVYQGIASGENKSLQEALSVSGQFDQRFSDFKQEVFFLKAWARQKLGVEQTDLDLAVKTFLRVDSDLTQLHVHDVNVDFQSFNWGDFAQGCQDLQAASSEYVASLISGFCMMKANRILEAKKVFEVLLPEHHSDGVLQSLYAATLLRLDQLPQAKNILGYMNQIDDKQPVVETLLRGCLMGQDVTCVDAIFKGRQGRHLSLLYSHWGNSFLNKQVDPRVAKHSVELGLEVSPNFSPLIILKRQLP